MAFRYDPSTAFGRALLELADADALRAAGGIYPVVSVLTFIPEDLHPAILDGTSTEDVTSYIQDAADSMSPTIGGTIRFPTGLYNTTSAITLQNRTTVLGDGFFSSIVSSTGDHPLFVAGDTDTACSRIIFRDIYLRRTGSGSFSTYHVEFANPDKILFDHVRCDMTAGLADTNIGGVYFYLDGNPSNVPQLCDFRHCHFARVSVYFENMQDHIFTDCWLWGNERQFAVKTLTGGITITGGSLVGGSAGALIVDGATFGDAGRVQCTGVFFDGSSVDDTGHGASITNATRCIFTGCIFDTWWECGIYLEDCTHITIDDCEFFGNNRGDIANRPDIWINGVSNAPDSISIDNTRHSRGTRSNTSAVIRAQNNGVTPTNVRVGHYQVPITTGYSSPWLAGAANSRGFITSFVFYRDNVAATLTDDIIENGSAVKAVLCPYSGSISAVAVRGSAARTAGTLTVEIFVQGSDTGIDIVIDGTNTTQNYERFNRGAYPVDAGNYIDVRITTDGSWAPTTDDIVVTVFVEI